MMKARSQSGIHSIELIGGLVFLIPIVLYAIDYATIFYGNSMNTNVCSAACRAAAQGPPSGLGSDPNNTPKARAQAAMARMIQPNAVVRMKKTIRVGEDCQAPIPAPPFGGPVRGSVSLKTRCDVFPPFLLPFVDKDVTLYSTQTYPWTWTMAANYTGSNPGSMPGITGSPGTPQQPMQPYSINTTNYAPGSPGAFSGQRSPIGGGGPQDLQVPIPDQAP